MKTDFRRCPWDVEVAGSFGWLAAVVCGRRGVGCLRERVVVCSGVWFWLGMVRNVEVKFK